MRGIRRAVLAIMVGFVTVVGLAQAPTTDLIAARQSLGSTGLRSATIRFTYQAAIQGEITNGRSAPYKGQGILRYARPAKYRLERLRTQPSGAKVLQVAVDDGTRYARWWFRGRRLQLVSLDPSAIASDRRRLEREVLVYLAALLLADAEFMKYEPYGNGDGFTVTGARGASAILLMKDGRVQDVRYVKPKAVPIVITPGGTSNLPEDTQDVLARVSDFRTTGTGLLPYRFRAEYEQGWEELTIESYVLNEPISNSEFEPPPAKNKGTP